MDSSVQPGRYVAAVSGGVDSMALLDILVQWSAGPTASRSVRSAGLAAGLLDWPPGGLIVAHFDHGIRKDSAVDRELVRKTAAAYGLPFVAEEGKLGPGTSEATARSARYAFLERVRSEYGARAIITAHHQDDVLETAILNILRGTGRRGLTALGSHGHIIRPLLHVTKDELLEYARANMLDWYEDSTNTDERYLRNYVRRRILPRFTEDGRQKLLQIIASTREINSELDAQLVTIVDAQPHAYALDRRMLALLPHAVARELLASWLRLRGVAGYDARTLERVVVAAKTQAPGAIIDITGGAKLRITKDNLALDMPER